MEGSVPPQGVGDDPLYPESAAYHEAGHIVIAAAQGIRLSRYGVHVDRDGRGVAFYEIRRPLKNSDAPCPTTREQTIIAAYAGLIAQCEFHPTCSRRGANDDQVGIDELLDEIGTDGLCPPLTRGTAEIELHAEAVLLVRKHWEALRTVARELWKQPYTPRRFEPFRGWSDQPREKKLTGARVVEILADFVGFGFVTIWDPRNDYIHD